MRNKKKIAVSLMVAMCLILLGTISLSGLDTEASRRLKATKSLSIKETTESNITSVEVTISTGIGYKNEVEMSAGDTGLLNTRVNSTAETADQSKITITCDHPEYLVDGMIKNNREFKLVQNVPTDTTIIFTATSTVDPSKSATATVKVVEKPELKEIKVHAPEGYTEKEVSGKTEIEVPFGNKSIALVGEPKYSGDYKWSPKWSVGFTLNSDGQRVTEEEKKITINATTGVVTIPDGAEEGYHTTVILKSAKGENIKGTAIIRLVNGSTSDITSVEVTISTGIGYKNEVEMSAGDTGLLNTRVNSTAETADQSKITITCDHPEYLVDGMIKNNREFKLVQNVPTDTTIIFTATSTVDPSKSATATVKVVEKPELKEIKVHAPEGYTEKEVSGKTEIEVPFGNKSIALVGEPKYSGDYKWSPKWSVGFTLNSDGQRVTEEEKKITINATTGVVTIPDGAEEGYHTTVTLKSAKGENIKGTAIIRLVNGSTNPGTGTLNGISITAPDGYEINQGVIELYPGTSIKLNGEVDKTADYVWTPSWKAGPTFDASDEQKKIPSISINEDTGEVTVSSSYAEDGDYADITLTQKNDDSGIQATVRIKVKYWNITVDAEPAGLINTEEGVSPARASKDEIVTFFSAYRGAVDAAGQKYIFSHWKTDDQNKDLTNYNRGGLVDGATVGDAFKMPERDVHLTAVFEKSWQVKEKTTAPGGNVPSFIMGKADYPEGKRVEATISIPQLEGMHLIVKNIKVVKANGDEIPFERKELTEFDLIGIYFTMPAEEVTINLTLARDTDADKKLTLGDVTGTLVSGTAGTASTEVTVSGYADGEVLSVGESYSEGTLKDESDRTAGLSFAVSSVTNGKAQVTIQTDQAVPAGTYSFAVVASDGKAKATGKVMIHEAEAKSLTVKGTSLELEEHATGELTLKGTSLNLKNGTAVKAIETDAKGTEKTFGKTEGLVFDDATIADNAFTMKAHLSKTVAAGTYYFKVQAGDTVSEVASIVVTRTKKEEPTPPVEEKEYSINASCNPNQGSIEIRVNGAEARKAKKGDKVTLTAVAKSGYKLKNWSLNMDMTTITPSEGTLTDTTVSFLMPEGTVTVGAAFESTATENPDTPTSVAPTITAFVVANVNGVIDQSNGQITVVVPNGTDVTALKPAVAVSDGATVTPNSGAAVNFTDAVVYTVTSASGETKQYVVTVKVQEASVSDSLWDQITNPEGDRSWWKKADSIKSHKKNKYPKYW